MLTKWRHDTYPNTSGPVGEIVSDYLGNTYQAHSIGGSQGMLVTKFDKNGFPLWSNRFGNASPFGRLSPDYMFFRGGILWVIGTEFIPFGSNGDDLFIRKIDTLGNELMAFHYPSPGSDRVLGALFLQNGNLVISLHDQATTYPHLHRLLCYAANDSLLLWDIPGASNESPSFPSVISPDERGNIFLTQIVSVQPAYFTNIKKISPQGNLIWNYQLNGGIHSTATALDGRTLIANEPLGSIPTVICLDSSGNTLWQIPINLYYLNGLIATEDKGWLLSGTDLHGNILKLDSAGNEQWRVSAPDNYSGRIYNYGNTYSVDSSDIFSFFYTSFAGSLDFFDFYILRVTANGIFRDMSSIVFPFNTTDQFQNFDYCLYPDGDVGVYLARVQRAHLNNYLWITARYCAKGCEPNFSGKAYNDSDSNCVQGAAEVIVPNSIIAYDNGSRYFTTNTAGDYFGIAQNGTHSVELNLYPPYSVSCSNFSHTFTIDSLSLDTAGLNFGIIIDSSYRDLGVNIHLGPVRPGFHQLHTISYENLGVYIETGSVSYKLDSIFNFVGATPAPDTIIGDSLVWDFVNLQPFQRRSLVVETNISAVAQIGMMIETFAKLTSDNIESRYINNRDYWTTWVSGSYDPNDKAVSPTGTGPFGAISLNDSILEYTIRFENVGNDTAFTVLVKDTISEFLNLTTLRVINESHPWEMDIYDDRTIVWTFKDIMLPDSGRDPIHSKGFIKYQIKTSSDLPLGTQIKNTASIYFDYNAAVVTNTVVNTISKHVAVNDYASEYASLQFQVFPNPARETLHVQALIEPFKGNLQLEIVDLQGRILKQSLPFNSQIDLSISDLASGLYLCRVHDLRKKFVGTVRFVIE